ncbi:hypothetical protein NVV95_08300 [Herbiconiux sp. CPCC 205716]|uniref:Secreted protein n=1 Tax=Herbiconiux gentiana TaxID=2970912 RepID=A0ABT2GED6_9MICO|nr:hypothetical protein [Herbiconiux gentiana]MCS5714552.1 hypothetical protein [Herbiconiux gentiana]
MTKRIEIRARRGNLTAIGILTLVLYSALAPSSHASAADLEEKLQSPAASQESPSGPLDEDTYAGPVLIATTEGDVYVVVQAGELMTVAAQVRAEVAAGTLDPRELADETKELRAGGCRDWANAVASPFGYAASTNGCAVIGYPGYTRTYNWNNGSDVQICVQAKAFTSPGVQSWSSIGCQGNRDFAVAWGNTFAHNQVRGRSLSGATGASYIWWD